VVPTTVVELHSLVVLRPHCRSWLQISCEYFPGNTLVLIGWKISEGTLVKAMFTVRIYGPEHKQIADNVTVYACRNETRWLKTQPILYTLQAFKGVLKEVPD
jgi:hypothetical protein